jgi:hypothetical protein
MMTCDCAKRASDKARRLTRQSTVALKTVTGKGNSKFDAGKRRGYWNEYHRCRHGAELFRAFAAELRKKEKA